MTIHLNEPHKPRNKMSRRERLKSYASEISYALELVCLRFDTLNHLINGDDGKERIYLTLTTPKNERDVFAFHAASRLKMIRVVTGRSSQFDMDPFDKRKLFIISDMSPAWREYQSEIEDLIESFTVLIDAQVRVNLPPGKHGQYCRLTQTLESELTLVLKTVTGKYGVQ